MFGGPAAIVLGLLLIFLLPGFGLTRAIWPERRVLRPLSLRALVEQLTTSLVLSVVATVLVGFAWLGSSAGVQATWSDPVVEGTLALLAAAALVVAAARGSFARVPPEAPRLEPEGGHEGPLELLRRLDQYERDERRLEHRLRTAGEASSEGRTIRAELDRLRAEAEALKERRESEYAQ
jgi:hypothetical protein